MEQIFGQVIDTIQHYFAPFLFVISIVVFVHEFGHYWVARMCGVRIEAFSIGFGKEIFGWVDKRGTRWKVCWLPFGGYVKMFGDAGPASTPDGKIINAMSEEDKKVSFFYQPVDKRIAIVAAGPGINYLFAIIVLACLFTFQGQPYSPAEVGALVENGAAARAGVQIGDHVVAIDGEKISRFEDIKRIVALNAGTPLAVDVERGGAIVSFKMTPEIVTVTDRLGGAHKIGRIGITTNKIEYKKWPPLKALSQAAIETWNLSAGALQAMGQMIIGTRAADDLGGPLRIAKMSGDVARDGFLAIVWFLAVISVNLGLINLFPIPLLDGGHIAFYLAEKIKGKALHQDVHEVGFRVGMILVFSLMIFATWNDLVQLKVISYLRSLFS